MAWIRRIGDWYYLYYRDESGKERSRALKTKHKREAEREQKIFEARQIEQGRLAPVRRNPACEDFWIEYARWAAQHRKKRTIDVKYHFWKRLIEHTGALRLGDVTRRDLSDFLTSLQENGLNAYSALDALTAVRALYNWAIKEGRFTGENPTQGIKKADFLKMWKDTQRKPIRVLGADELKALREKAEGKGDRDLHLTVLLGGFQGLRKHEIANFHMDWVDRESKMIRIRSVNGEFTLKTGQRTLPMSNVLLDALPDCETGYLFSPKRGSEGKGLYRIDKKKALVKLYEECGIEATDPFQSLRIGFGNLMYKKGVQLEELARWMGNSVAVLREWYLGEVEYDGAINIE